MSKKTLLTAFGFVALLATPALAQKPVHHHDASGPYASVAAPAPIAQDGRYVGTDPDVNVRAELQRDWQTSQGAN
ncbi:MAG TPA: hypothetical protein VKX28_11655 [Xanthobacteraceae bacterium]|nr:hypothetical protein [Xanthobacteraceae bacterium]